MSKYKLGPRLWHFGWAIVDDDGLAAILTESQDPEVWKLMTAVEDADPPTMAEIQPMVRRVANTLRIERGRAEAEESAAANRPHRSMIQEFQDQEDAMKARSKRRGR